MNALIIAGCLALGLVAKVHVRRRAVESDERYERELMEPIHTRRDAEAWDDFYSYLRRERRHAWAEQQRMLANRRAR